MLSLCLKKGTSQTEGKKKVIKTTGRLLLFVPGKREKYGRTRKSQKEDEEVRSVDKIL